MTSFEKEYRRIKWSVYEIGEYFYELKLINAENEPERLMEVVEKYEKYLKLILDFSDELLKKEALLKKTKNRKMSVGRRNKLIEVKQIQKRFSKIAKEIDKIDKENERKNKRKSKDE